MNPLKQYYKLFSKEPLVLTLGLGHTFFSGFGQTFFLSLFVAPIMAEYSLTRSEWGFWYSALTLVGALFMFLLGPLIDKKDLRYYSLFSGSLLLIATLLGYWSPHFYVLIFALFIIRAAGQGLLSHIAQTTTSRYFKEDRGKALGLISLGYPLSEMVLPFLAAIIYSQGDWKNAFLVMAALIAFVFIPLTQTLLGKSQNIRNPQVVVEKHETDNQQKHSNRSDVLKDIRYWSYLPIAITPPFLITGFFIHQSALTDIFENWNSKSFAIAITFFAIFRASGSLFIGPLIDRFGAVTLLMFYTTPIAIGCLLPALFNHDIVGVLLFILCGTTAGIGGSIKSASLVEIWGAKHLGAIRSMTGTFMVVSTALSPWLFGLILDSSLGFNHLLMGAVGFCLFTISIAYFGLLSSFKS
jgi:MFS family permease